MSTNTVDELLRRLAELLEWHDLGTGVLTPRPRGGRLQGEDAAAVAAVLDELAAVDEGLPSGRSPRSLIFGNGCFAIGRYPEALAVYQALAGTRPDDFAVQFNLGVTCLRRRRPDDACKAFTTALALDDAYAPAYYQRGNARDDTGDVEGALEDYATAVRLDPEFLQAYYNRGIVLTNLGRYQEAVQGV